MAQPRRKTKTKPELGAPVTPLYKPLQITPENAAEIVATGYQGRLQAAFEAQRKSRDLVSLKEEIAWAKARIKDDVALASEFNVNGADIAKAIAMLNSALDKLSDGDVTDVPELVGRAVELITDLHKARAVEVSALNYMKIVADLVSKEAQRARIMESIPTAEEWDVFRKVFLDCVFTGIRDFPGLPKATADMIWTKILDNFRSRMILDPDEVAVVRAARERTTDA